MANAGLTTKEAAARLNVAEVTVRLWCRQKRFPHARAVDTPRGSIWYIPEKDLSDFQPPQPGRPKSNGAPPAKRAKRGVKK
jgi:excisionase family DNA binding protein